MTKDSIDEQRLHEQRLYGEGLTTKTDYKDSSLHELNIVKKSTKISNCLELFFSILKLGCCLTSTLRKALPSVTEDED